MEDFFIRNLDLVFFVYGSVFMTIGAVVWLQPKERSRFKLAGILWLFVAYALIHAPADFIDMWNVIKGKNQFLFATAQVLTYISYVFLFEFGRRLIGFPRKITTLILSAAIGAIFLASILSRDFWTTSNILVGYFIRFPAGVMSGLGFLFYALRENALLKELKIRRYFFFASLSLLAWSFFCGLVRAKAGFFPANWLNTESFLSSVKIPVYVPRTICALVFTWAIYGILKIFNWEEEEERRTGIAEREKIEMISNELRGIVNIADELISCTDLNEFFKISVEFCREKLGMERCAIFLEEDGYMVGTYGTDKDGHTVDEHAQRFPKDATWENRCKMIKKGEPKWFVVEEPYLQWDGEKTVQIGKGRVVVTPIQSAKGVVGVFVNDMAISRAELNAINQDMLAVFASLLGDITERKRAEELIENHVCAIEIVNKELHSEIANRIRLEGELRTLSLTDSLTGLYNHRGFLVLAQQQMKEAKRNKQDVVLLFADLDNLKWINDTFGHQEGDFALAKAADIFKSCFRESDIIARIGGDEFVVLAIQASREAANNLITKLEIKLVDYNAEAGRRYPLSLSIGVSFAKSDAPCTIDDLLLSADKSMYEQKQRKRKSEK